MINAKSAIPKYFLYLLSRSGSTCVAFGKFKYRTTKVVAVAIKIALIKNK